ncbi:MAG: enoyl-CoA hydratase-related protein [Sphingomonadaceae bacterium]
MAYEGFGKMLIERRGAILVGTMNEPPMNPIGAQLDAEILRFLREANADNEVKVIVLTGAGDKAFSAGGDLNWMKEDFEKPTRPHWSLGMPYVKDMLSTVMNLRKPFITRVNGHAMGLGATLAVLSDISIMSERGKIGDTHVKVGLAAGDGGALLWPLLMGFANARRYLLTGDLMTGKEAAELGLVTMAVPPEELDAVTYDFAERLASGATQAINATKIAINLLLRNMTESLIEANYGLEMQSALSADHKEAVNAFLEGREPTFTGD